MISGTMTQPTSGLNMEQLNDLLGSFKNDILSGVDERFSSFQPTQAYEPVDYSGQFGGLEEKIAGIEQQLSSMPGPAGVDYGKIQSMIDSSVGGIDIPSYQAPDLSALTGRLDQIDNRFNNLPQAPAIDYGKIDSLIGNKIGSLDIPTYEPTDLSGINNRIDQLAGKFDNFTPPSVDLNPITSQIDDLKLQVGNLQPQAVDLSPLTGQISDLQSQFDGFMSDNKADGPAFAQIDPAVMDQLTSANDDRFGSIAEDIQGLGSRLDKIAAAPQLPTLGPDALDNHLSMIDERFGSMDQRLNEALNREDPFVTALNSIQNGDYQFNIGDQNYDFSNLFPHVDSIAPGRGNGGFNGDAPGGYIPPFGGYTPPANPSPVTPPPAVNPARPPEVIDGIDWNRYGRDYGEVDFNVGGTAGGNAGGSFPQPGQGGFDLQGLLSNLGL